MAMLLTQEKIYFATSAAKGIVLGRYADDSETSGNTNWKGWWRAIGNPKENEG